MSRTGSGMGYVCHTHYARPSIVTVTYGHLDCGDLLAFSCNRG